MRRLRRSSTASAPTAYVDWYKNILLNLFAIRKVAGDLLSATLVKAFEDELVASMADVDRCLTQAYDHKLKGEDVSPLLDACHMATMHQFVLDWAPPSPTSSTSSRVSASCPFHTRWKSASASPK
jgi:hypothetical protein